MEIVPYIIHPEIQKITKLFKLDALSLDRYLYDDIHENHNYLRTLDPKDWKEQDHYAVLRLKKVRFNASQELIKQAYRKQLLDHHPDKGKQRLRKCDGESDDYFSCITRAFDFLKEQVTRNSYDSVDPYFDNSIPTMRDAKERFYKAFGPAFQRNSRWSKIQPVPLLGDDSTDIDDVYRFYKFWDDFRSWREFSYLDKESKEQCDSRDERRYNDKLNKAERKLKSQEEYKRINTLVDMAKANDPRIIKYNAGIKAAKEAEKKAKADRKLELKMAAEKIIREEKEKLEREEAEKQQKIKDEATNLKKQKEAVKKLHKNEKRKLRKIVESHNHFGEILSKSHSNKKSAEVCKIEIESLVDMLCVKMTLDDITAMNLKLENSQEPEMLVTLKEAEEKTSGKASAIFHTA